MFWYHCQLNFDKKSIKWDARSWQKLFNEIYTAEFVFRINQLLKIYSDEIRVLQKIKAAMHRLMNNFSVTWKNAYNQTTESKSLSLNIYSKKLDSTVDVDNDNWAIYEHLLSDIYILKNLLTNFKALCTRNAVDLTNISVKTMWKSTTKLAVDYFKFFDLYWRLIMTIIRTNEAWMNKNDCFICECTQLTKHYSEIALSLNRFDSQCDDSDTT